MKRLEAITYVFRDTYDASEPTRNMIRARRELDEVLGRSLVVAVKELGDSPLVVRREEETWSAGCYNGYDVMFLEAPIIVQTLDEFYDEESGND